MDLLVVALAFGTIFLVELPDKTFIATLVLSTRFRPLWVWIGVGLAFLVQTGIAVGLGSVVAQLPITWVRSGAALLFLGGALLLLREARTDPDQPDTEDADPAGPGQEYADRAGGPRRGLGAVAASFLVLFAAEWGDLSQLLTLSLVARYDAPFSVFAGAWGALLTVSGLAVLAGRVLLARIRLSTLHYVGSGVCFLLFVLTLVEVLGS
ncbi:TMEM165/GDT1 family protein [Nocardioides donggukensis]|uniref:GDT1 family protein n=1 Tax=Nocardioides donggukensis TaxID=2774019 RepID=A0A927PZV3_9ACTN|nr:TMEM165/GDT1 family protein [Nocardioides donggukensis]MBD8868097.1 TMEM165/GDT1 family protein [Nocardioides donggukensis]